MSNMSNRKAHKSIIEIQKSKSEKKKLAINNISLGCNWKTGSLFGKKAKITTQQLDEFLDQNPEPTTRKQTTKHNPTQIKSRQIVK